VTPPSRSRPHAAQAAPILVTTPESLYILTSESGRKTLANTAP
jgi:Lhr-like helicase